MLRSMSGKQFLEWRAYAELEPFDEVRADLRTAHLVQTVRAFAGDKATLSDCLLPFGEEDAPEPKVKDWREIKAAGDAWAAALNARQPSATPTTPAPPLNPRRRRSP
jgi:hypothetical protein